MPVALCDGCLTRHVLYLRSTAAHFVMCFTCVFSALSPQQVAADQAERQAAKVARQKTDLIQELMDAVTVGSGQGQGPPDDELSPRVLIGHGGRG